MKKIILAILFLFVFVNPAWSATYYMRADGTAANKGAAGGPCGTVGNCMNATVHDGETFAGLDVIILCDDGGAYRHRFEIPSSGTSGNVITYEAASGDTPQIFGSIEKDDSGDWTEESSNIWYCTGITVDPNIYGGTIWRDNVAMTEEANKVDLNADGEWWYDSGNTRVYVYDTANPGTTYDFEMPQEGFAVDFNGHDYITLDTIDMRYATGSGTRLVGSTNITFTDCKSMYHGNCGFYQRSASGSNTWTDCEAAYNVQSGLQIDGDTGGDGGSNVIDGGLFHHNGQTNGNGHGIYLHTSNSNTVKKAKIYLNQTTYAVAGIGLRVITCDSCTFEKNELYENDDQDIYLSIGSDSNIIRYNYIHDTTEHAIAISGSDSNEIYGNITHNNQGAGICLWYSAGTCDGNKIYNNTFVDHHENYSDYGLIYFYNEAGGSAPANNIIKNNIFSMSSIHSSGYLVYARNITDAAGLDTNTFDYNQYYANGATNIFHWYSAGAGVDYTSLANWQSGESQDPNSASGDPLFTNLSGDDFSLTSGSPCKDVGEDLGSGSCPGIYCALDPTSSWPDSVFLIDQDPDWEIGAYVFVGGGPPPTPPMSISDGGTGSACDGGTGTVFDGWE